MVYKSLHLGKANHRQQSHSKVGIKTGEKAFNKGTRQLKGDL